MLTSLREEAGIAQAYLADKLGIDQSAVSRAERGERRISVGEFLDWLDVLGVQLSDVAERLQAAWDQQRAGSADG
ncbi:MAG: helix-turn-helix transcriptional regulator [Actinomycetota bacterium]|nr:helix-turn-helix transcriptional regulator [Actinomycetota bacterium]